MTQIGSFSKDVTSLTYNLNPVHNSAHLVQCSTACAMLCIYLIRCMIILVNLLYVSRKSFTVFLCQSVVDIFSARNTITFDVTNFGEHFNLSDNPVYLENY